MPNPFAGDIKIPVVGKVPKGVAAAGVGGVAIAIIIFWRKRKAASSAATALTPATDPSEATDPAGNIGTIDPATGYVEGSPEDLSALSSQADWETGTDFSGGDGGGGDESIGTQVTNGPPFSSNAAWEQYAISIVTATDPNQDPGALATDLGAYLAGAQVTQAQHDVIQTAIGLAGPVPVTGPNGYPPSINVAGSISGTGSTPGAVSLAKGTVTSSSITVTWTAVSGATSYAYTATGPGGYSKTGTVTTTSVQLTGLTAGGSYTISVHAVNASGAGPTSSITIAALAAVTTTPPPTTTPPAATYIPVKVVKFTTANPAWDATLSGIAEHEGYGGDWQTIWNDPKNAALKALRKTPDMIREGDVVQVKKK